MHVSLIVASTPAGVIGRDGDLPWRISSDLRRFKQLTMGHHVLMGRKTFQSLPRPLPGRTMIVLTRQESFVPGGEALVAHDLDQALALAAGDDELFIIGGAEIYRQALVRADRIYFTRVDADLAGDVHFPPVDWSQWELVEETAHPADEKNQFATTFQIWRRLAL